MEIIDKLIDFMLHVKIDSERNFPLGLNTIINKDIDPNLRNKIWRMTELIKHPQYHKEGSCFNHTCLVMRYVFKLGGDRDDLIAALFHDIGEYPIVQRGYQEILSVTNLGNYGIKYPNEIEIITNVVKSMVVKKMPFPINDSRLEFLNEDAKNYFGNLKIKNKGHEDYAANFVTKVIKPEDVDDLESIKFLIKYHMMGHFIDQIKFEKEKVISIFTSKYFQRLKRLWLSDINGRISDDPEMSFDELERRINSNQFIRKLFCE